MTDSCSGMFTIITLVVGVGVLVLLLACVGAAAGTGATGIVDGDGGADRVGMRTVEAAA